MSPLMSACNASYCINYCMCMYCFVYACIPTTVFCMYRTTQ